MPNKAKMLPGHTMLNAIVPVTLKGQVKSKAALDGIQMQEAVRIALEAYTKKERPSALEDKNKDSKLQNPDYTVTKLLNCRNRLRELSSDLENIIGDLNVSTRSGTTDQTIEPGVAAGVAELLPGPRTVEHRRAKVTRIAGKRGDR